MRGRISNSGGRAHPVVAVGVAGPADGNLRRLSAAPSGHAACNARRCGVALERKNCGVALHSHGSRMGPERELHRSYTDLLCHFPIRTSGQVFHAPSAPATTWCVPAILQDRAGAQERSQTYCVGNGSLLELRSHTISCGNIAKTKSHWRLDKIKRSEAQQICSVRRE